MSDPARRVKALDGSRGVPYALPVLRAWLFAVSMPFAVVSCATRSGDRPTANAPAARAVPSARSVEGAPRQGSTHPAAAAPVATCDGGEISSTIFPVSMDYEYPITVELVCEGGAPTWRSTAPESETTKNPMSGDDWNRAVDAARTIRVSSCGGGPRDAYVHRVRIVIPGRFEEFECAAKNLPRGFDEIEKLIDRYAPPLPEFQGQGWSDWLR